MKIKLNPEVVDLDVFTVNEAKEFIRARLKEEAKRMLWDKKTPNSVSCPCCGKGVSINIREPNLLKWGLPLWELYKVSGSSGEPVHGTQLFTEMAKSTNETIRFRGEKASRNRDWTRWALWGLIKREKKSKYIVTKDGADFIYERKLIPRRIATLNGEILAEDKDVMSFRELVESEGWDYDALLTEKKQLEMF